MTKKVVIIDYGVGNLLSVARAFEHCGASVTISGDPSAARHADRVVLPGVGAFGDCMAELSRRNLIPALHEFFATKKPFLGICVGMQMLFETGEEFGLHNGLGVIPGRVSAIPASNSDGHPHKIPHIGWAPLLPIENIDWAGTILADTTPQDSVYFVHSFAAIPTDPATLLAITVYNGRQITAVVRTGNICGCQFHPEKSGPAGLTILRRFLSL